jgi:hypothetical protein
MRIARDRDEARIGQAERLPVAVDDDPGQHAHAKRFRECVEAAAIGIRGFVRFGEPEQRAAAFDVIDERVRGGRRERDLRIGDDDEIGVVRHLARARQRQRDCADASIGERGDELAEVGIRLAERRALALAFEERDDAFARTRQAQQRARKLAFAEDFQALAAIAVTQFEFAIERHARCAHRGRVFVGIDEAQREVGFRAVVALDEIRNDLAQTALLARVADDVDRPVELAEQRDRIRRQARRVRVAPVAVDAVARAEETGERRGDEHERCENQVAETRLHASALARRSSSRRAASASATAATMRK